MTIIKIWVIFLGISFEFQPKCLWFFGIVQFAPNQYGAGIGLLGFVLIIKFWKFWGKINPPALPGAVVPIK